MAIANPTVPQNRIPDIVPPPDGHDLEQQANGQMLPILSPLEFPDDVDFNEVMRAAGYHQATALGAFDECEAWELGGNGQAYRWMLIITPFSSRVNFVWCRNLPELLAALKHVRDLVETSRLNADFYRVEIEVHQDKVLKEADCLGIKRW